VELAVPTHGAHTRDIQTPHSALGTWQRAAIPRAQSPLAQSTGVAANSAVSTAGARLTR
jgi:hypothetical protein